MGLTANNQANGFSGKVFGPAQGAFARGMAGIIDNARVFGQITSVPQGMNGQNALRMTIKVGGNISARVKGDVGFTAAAKGAGNMAAAASGVAGFTANGNTAYNGTATFAGVFNWTALGSGLGSMAAKMDILARPSAFDIAQEVWNSQKTAFASTGTLGKSISDAEAAAKLGAALSA